MNQTIRMYLAYQRIADGRVQIRRYSPDRVSPISRADPQFLGFEKQSSQATAWLAANGEPTWPECLAATLPIYPYMVSENGQEYKAWERRPITNGGVYQVVNEAAAVNEDALVGVMRMLKANKGEK